MLLRIAGLFALVFVFSANIAEASMIDSFDAGAQSLFVSSGQPTASQQVNVGTGTAIGGYRDISLELSSGYLDFANVMVSGSQGLFAFTQFNNTCAGKAWITWDGADSPGIRSYSLGANLYDGGQNGFLIDVGDTTGTGMDLKMTVYTTDSTHSSSYSQTLASGFSGPLNISYASFSQSGSDGPAVFSSAGAIVLELDGTGHGGSNIALNSIETVPEPSTLVLLAFGAMAFLGFGRRWRRT